VPVQVAVEKFVVFASEIGGGALAGLEFWERRRPA